MKKWFNGCALLQQLVSRLACNLLKNISNTGQGNLLKANVLIVSGHVYSDIGKDLEAKELYENALRIQKGIFGEELPATAAACNNLGLVQVKLANYSEAKKVFEKALVIRKRILGAEHPSLAVI